MAITRTARLARMLDGSRPVVLSLPEAASQTFKVGDLVYMSSGYLTVCGADPAKITGISKADGHNDASNGTYNVDVLVITLNMLVAMQVYHSTPANNVIEAADRFKAYGIAVSSNTWYIDKTDTSATRCRIVEFRDALGAENGVVHVQFFSANLDLGGC